MDTFKLLKECRDEVAEAFSIVYGKKVRFLETRRGEPYCYHLTGFNLGRVIAVRMQIKEGTDEKRRMHFARYIPPGKQHNYILQRAIAEIEEKFGEDMSISDRHAFVKYNSEDTFKMPVDGLGISITFEDPSAVREKLLAIDNIVDAAMKKPGDAIDLRMANKIESDYTPFW